MVVIRIVLFARLPMCLVSAKFVANLWTEFAAQHSEALATNGKEPQNPNKLVVAATFETAKT